MKHFELNFSRKTKAVTLAVTISGSLLAYFGSESRIQETSQNTWFKYPVTAPDTIPTPSQESVDLAMEIYGITVPSNASRPVFDALVRDRGLTIRRGWFNKATVVIGPSAFSSWALLGSTLSHELEVHCQQNFMMISLMDKIGLDGTGTAEREAYLHELANAQRFGMENFDYRLIQETMDYYYPESRKDAKISTAMVTQNFGRWLARQLISPTAPNNR